MRALLALLPLSIMIGACASTTDTVSESHGAVTSKSTAGCDQSRDDILASAGTPERQAAIQRGFAWLDANVPYNQQATHEGWRTDCSGFVSMCWNLSQSFTTLDFKNGSAENTILGSFDELQPGDGMVYRSGDNGHAMLFLGWQDDAHSAACVLEEADTNDDMQFGPRSMAQIEAQGYVAMRANSLPAADPQADPVDETQDDPEAAPTGDDDDDSTETAAAPVEGTPCSDDDGDDICNPNLSGTGLTCSQGQCVPGCKVDLGCPGKLLCVNAKCQ